MPIIMHKQACNLQKEARFSFQQMSFVSKLCFQHPRTEGQYYETYIEPFQHAYIKT